MMGSEKELSKHYLNVHIYIYIFINIDVYLIIYTSLYELNICIYNIYICCIYIYTYALFDIVYIFTTIHRNLFLFLFSYRCKSFRPHSAA